MLNLLQDDAYTKRHRRIAAALRASLHPDSVEPVNPAHVLPRLKALGAAVSVCHLVLGRDRWLVSIQVGHAPSCDDDRGPLSFGTSDAYDPEPESPAALCARSASDVRQMQLADRDRVCTPLTFVHAGMETNSPFVYTLSYAASVADLCKAALSACGKATATNPAFKSCLARAKIAVALTRLAIAVSTGRVHVPLHSTQRSEMRRCRSALRGLEDAVTRATYAVLVEIGDGESCRAALAAACYHDAAELVLLCMEARDKCDAPPPTGAGDADLGALFDAARDCERAVHDPAFMTTAAGQGRVPIEAARVESADDGVQPRFDDWSRDAVCYKAPDHHRRAGRSFRAHLSNEDGIPELLGLDRTHEWDYIMWLRK